MTKEELKEKYKESLIGIWDSIRSTHKGNESCAGVNCSDCPFDEESSCTICSSIENVEQWAKQLGNQNTMRK